MISNILFAANMAIEQEVIGAAITIAFLTLYLHSSDVLYTNTARSIEAEQRLALTETLTSEVGLLQNFRAYKKWIPLPSYFER